MQLQLETAEAALRTLAATHHVAAQVACLRSIKNKLAGHELRKIEYIQAGLIPTLEQLLSNLSTLSEEDEDEPENGEQEDATWAQVASITGSIANAGTPFTAPILSSTLPQLLLQKLVQTEDNRLELWILRCLNTIADNLPLTSDIEWAPSDAMAKLIYTPTILPRIANAINRTPRNYQQQQSMEAALNLFCKTCTTDRQKNILVEAQVLDMLCAELADFISLHKFSIWNGSRLCHVVHRLSDSATDQNHHISLVLDTIALIIHSSHTFAKTFASHAALMAAISAVPHEHGNPHNPNDALDTSALVEIPLPYVPDPTALNQARRSPFPPLSASSTLKRRTSSMRAPPDHHAMIIDDDDRDVQGSYLIVPWLLYIVRTCKGRRRISAARLLGILKLHGLVPPVRARSFSSLLVPILVDLLQSPSAEDSAQRVASSLTRVPSILALIVRDNELLQKAAFEMQAISILVGALKKSFDMFPDVATTINLWWPEKLDAPLIAGSTTCCLGISGPMKLMREAMSWREGLLQALAAITPDNESYRKEVVDVGGLQQIIAALEPFKYPQSRNDKGDVIGVIGNSSEVLIAACGAVRALTRSATALRTKLVDAEVAKPIIKLLHTAEPEVRIAATMVMSNLAHDFSPMKPSIEPVVRKLCEQAHSANARLRLESLFALKALVNNSKNDLKRKIVEELGPYWIKHLISTDPHDVPPGVVIGLKQREYRKGSMVRVFGEAMDVDDASSSEGEPDEVTDYSAHTLEQDLDIQAELLGFLRNLTTGERPDEIIDYLLEHVGQEDFIQILIERLKNGTTQRPLASPPPRAIMENSLYILTHLCAAEKKYRMFIYQNVVLMKQVSALLGHHQSEVRCAACWLVTNLVYANSNESFEMLLLRARELQKLGILNQIRRMEKSDPDMNVKERAATAADCFSKLLDRH